MRRTLIVFGGVCILTVVSCALVNLVKGEPSWFNHKKHMDEGATCDICHQTYSKEAQAGMPTIETCLECHDKITDEQVKANPYLAALREKRPIEWRRMMKVPADLIFSHAGHDKAKVACVSCHGNMGEATAITAQNIPSMNACTACHREKDISADCSVCHKEIRKDQPPRSHKQLWTKRHGQVVRESDRNIPVDCAHCHTESVCVSCHQETKPGDHTNQWRHIGHGIASGIARDRCETCHRPDYCERCHEETAPRSHRTGWGSPNDRHCLSCHLPLNNMVSNCLTCHKKIEHSSAPAMPVGHLPESNCRLCHINLGHPDNGDNCRFCH